MWHKENIPYLRNITDQPSSGLRTDNYSTIWWKETGSEDIKYRESLGPRPLPALSRKYRDLEKDLYFILNILWPQEKLPRARLFLTTSSSVASWRKNTVLLGQVL